MVVWLWGSPLLNERREVEFEIDKARMEDIDQVMNINLRTLPENYPRYFFEYLLINYPEAFLVARLGEKVIGYIMCRVEDSISLTIPLKRVKKGHIVSFAVLP
jgi:ribosomal-protein-alanine N-acetyltransferase